MSLRTRLAVLAAAAVAIAVVLVAAFAFRASQQQQQDALDDALVDRATELANRASRTADLVVELRGVGRFFEPEGLIQLLDENGETIRPPGQPALAVEPAELAVIETGRPVVRDVEIDEGPFRQVTVPVPDDVGGLRPGPPGFELESPLEGERALQLAESRQALDDSLAGLRRTLLLTALLGVALAAVIGTVVARRALRPVGRLTEAAEHVASTQDLAATIEVERPDELGRLATAFNAMLKALDRSRVQQQQLVTDASHELRTPLTSLRTNVELLQRAEDLPTEQRRQIVDDAVEELGELSALVAELVDLATDGRRAAERWEPVELGSVVESVVDRFRRRRTGPIEVDLDDTVVDGNPVLIERAVSNLVDNATKWSEDDQPIAVEVRVGRVGVRDHGPGIDPAERPRVFDRFHRAPGSQDRPGSGLGLAIVHQIVQTHGGEVFVEDPPPGQPGIVVGFTLPVPDGDDAT